MAAQNPGNRRRRGTGLLLGALLAALFAPAPAFAQTTVPEFFFPRRDFRIPFTEPNDRRVVRLTLFVSEDSGHSWQSIGSATPDQHSFSCTAPHDGWFWFATQTQDADGRLVPPDTQHLQVSIKICVDTQRPLISLRQVQPREGTVAVEWDVQDDNLDLQSLRIDYRPVGATDARQIQSLPIPPVAHGDKGWTPPGANTPVEVRLWVQDRAKNASERVITVTPGQAAPAAGGLGPVPVKHVGSKEFQLRCKIANQGESKVQGIDVWVLRDNVWNKIPADPKNYTLDGDRATCAIRVQNSGRWGFTLIPRSGVGLADPPPRPGDPPHIWIEVDETKPVVTIQKVDVGTGQDLGRMTVYWSASDVHLRPKPISLSWAPKQDGPWTPLAGPLDNTGLYTVDTRSVNPPVPYEFYLRIEAMDEAGNAGSAVTRETVKVDTKIPRAEAVDVVLPETPSRVPNMGVTPGER
jgi:hypothetical protein